MLRHAPVKWESGQRRLAFELQLHGTCAKGVIASAEYTPFGRVGLGPRWHGPTGPILSSWVGTGSSYKEPDVFLFHTVDLI